MPVLRLILFVKVREGFFTWDNEVWFDCEGHVLTYTTRKSEKEGP